MALQKVLYISGKTIIEADNLNDIQDAIIALEGKAIPESTSDLTNDSGFITNAVSDLANYFLKSETYSRDEINQKISAIPKFSIQVVSSLPTSGISATTVYLLKTGEESNNLYTEYIYVNGAWEYLGKQTVDLSGYALTTDIPTKLSGLTNDAGFIKNTVSNLTNYYKKSEVYSRSESEARYQLKGDYLTEIPSEYVTDDELSKKGFLTQHQDLSGYAKKATTLAGYGITDGATKTDVSNLSNEKADKSEVSTAVNTALAQAKASGEFDGEDGRRGYGLLAITTAPSSYTTAVNGLTPAYRISLSTVKTQANTTDVFAGDTLRYSYYHYPVIYVDSSYVYCTTRVSIRGATGAAGADGYTPVKGTDYYTAADQEAIVQQVITALGTPVFGRVDANNVITLTGELADGTYTLKYENAKGEVIEIGSLVNAKYTNQIPISTDTSGSVYNGVGYKEKTRGNSSGAEATVDNASATNPVFFTGFIPCKQGDVIRLKNCYLYASANNNSSVYGSDAFALRSGLYNSSKTKIAVESWGNLYKTNNAQDKFSNYTRVQVTADQYIDADVCDATEGLVTQFTIAYANTAYVRLCLAADKSHGFTPADAIVTVNQEID